MRIAHILNEIRFSGAEIMLEAAAPSMLEFTRPTIIATGDQVGDFAGRLERAGYEIVHIPSRSTFGILTELRRFLIVERFKLVHVHAERYALAYSLVCRLAGISSLRTVHNEFLFDGALRVRRKATRRLAHWLGTQHVACSRSVQRNEMQRFGLPMVVVDNWLDVDRIVEIASTRRYALRHQYGLNDDTFCTISIANEAPAKNLGNLFAGVLDAANHGVRIQHFHCGKIGPQLQAIADNSNGKIITPGTVSDISPYLAIADAFISSSYNEGGQLSLLEAAASGITSITTKVGLAEIFSNQPAVHFIEPTAISVTEKIKQIATTSEMTRFSEAQGLSTFTRSHFNPQRGVSDYRNLYESLTKSTSREMHANG